MLRDTLKAIVGPDGVAKTAADLQPHLSEWRDLWHGKALIMVSPDATEQVAAVVNACREARAAIVPQGGNTGLCGGAIPDTSGTQVLLSLSRMNRIRSISPNNHSMIADAGCTLAAVQMAAANVDRFFPLSLAAEGSCQIGGNLSTIAGGINVLKYGTARDLTLGLEVVLADGTIWNGLRSLRKDTAGYDLKQLFIGSEGTLGIITAASLRLFPAVRDARTAMIALASPDRAIELLARLRYQLNDQVQAFELIPDRAVRYVLRHIPSSRFPLELNSPWYVLLEAANPGNDDILEKQLTDALDAGLITDAAIAKSQSEAEQMWRLRHALSESQKKEGASLKHDISVPVDKLGEFLQAADEAVTQYMPGIRVVAFGHIGDGNIHYNLSQPCDHDAGEFLAARGPLETIVYDVVDRYGGSISAEHGIGQAKRDLLLHYRGETEVTLMKRIKAALDPDMLLNPGKVI